MKKSSDYEIFMLKIVFENIWSKKKKYVQKQICAKKQTFSNTIFSMNILFSGVLMRKRSAQNFSNFQMHPKKSNFDPPEREISTLVFFITRFRFYAVFEAR